MKSYILIQWRKGPVWARTRGPHRDPNVFPRDAIWGRDPWVDNRWSVRVTAKKISINRFLFFSHSCLSAWTVSYEKKCVFFLSFLCCTISFTPYFFKAESCCHCADEIFFLAVQYTEYSDWNKWTSRSAATVQYLLHRMPVYKQVFLRLQISIRNFA